MWARFDVAQVSNRLAGVVLNDEGVFELFVVGDVGAGAGEPGIVGRADGGAVPFDGRLRGPDAAVSTADGAQFEFRV